MTGAGAPVVAGPSSPGAPGAAPRRRPGRLSKVGLVGLVGLAVAVVGYQRQARRSAAAPDRTSFLTNFAPLKLVDQTGQPFDLGDLGGKVVLFNFMFTFCPNVCPVQTRALAEVQRALPERTRRLVRFVSVSVDPVHDTPAVLKAYGEQYRVDFSHWTFVSASAEDLHYLSERLHLFAKDDDSRPENHGTTLWLMDGRGRLMQRYVGTPPEVPRLVSELDHLAQLSE